EEPKKSYDALKDPSWVEAMQEELLQFTIQNVWILVDCPKGIRPIGTKWVLKNKKDERGIVIRNKARLVAQGHTQEEGIDYEEVSALVPRIEAIKLFLAYASFIGFIVYQIDVKSAFLYGTIDKEVYVMQPLGFQDLEFPDRVYKVEKAMYGLHQASRAWYGTLSKYLLDNGFQRGTIDQTPFIRKHRGDFLLVQVYVDDIIFRSSNPQLCREFEALMHDKFQISVMGDLNFFLECHLDAVKRIFRYLKGHPKLGQWYPKESPFDLVAYSDSDYGGATQDRKSTTGGCQFLERRLISWQCKKQTIVSTPTTEAEYVAAASGCGQVLWIQNQLLDYGSNFMNTKIHIDNNSAICIVRNPVYHSKTKHIEIRHHFIRDCFEKKLISVNHIPTDDNVADLLTKPFDVGKFQYLVVEQAMRGSVLGNHIICTTVARIKLLEHKDRGNPKPSGDDAPIKGMSMEIGEEVGVERNTELRSNDTEEMVNVLTSIEAANILTSGVAAVSVTPVAGVSTVGVPTVSRLFPTVSAIFTTASVVTPYSRRPRGISAKDKGKEIVVESEEPKKKKLQEQIDAQVAREMEEEIARKDQRMNEQLARDAEIARIHAEEELKMLIDGLDRSNEYQDHHAKILKYQAQKSKPLSKKEQRELYMSVLRSHAGWKTKHFRGMTLEEIKEKFIPVWKQLEDFVPMSSTEEGKRMKRKGLKLDERSSKRMKTSEDVSEEYLKEMMQLVPVEEVYVEALQVKHPIIDWKIHSEGKKDYWKIIILGG
nr:retrotransposon protein, putative, unclassified [Tanacetum cinerariifolium]